MKTYKSKRGRKPKLKRGRKPVQPKEWREYKYCMANFVFSDKPLKNMFPKTARVYGIAVKINQDSKSLLSLLEIANFTMLNKILKQQSEEFKNDPVTHNS